MFSFNRISQCSSVCRPSFFLLNNAKIPASMPFYTQKQYLLIQAFKERTSFDCATSSIRSSSIKSSFIEGRSFTSNTESENKELENLKELVNQLRSQVFFLKERLTHVEGKVMHTEYVRNPARNGLSKEMGVHLERYGSTGGGSLKIDDYHFNDNGIKIIAQYKKNLSSIEVNGHQGVKGEEYRVTESSILELAGKPLKKLIVSGYFQLSDEGLKTLSEKSPNLEELVIGEESSITDRGASFIATFKKLKVLTILEQKVTDSGVIELARGCQELCRVSLEDSKISDIGLKELITNCSMLNSLDLLRCPNITDTGIIELSENFKRFKWVSIHNNHNITDRAINAILENGHNLDYLDIKGCSKVSKATECAIGVYGLQL